MVFRMRGIQLPDWGTSLGSAVNRVWLEFLRREQRMERARVEHEMMMAYALAGSPEAPAEKRFELADGTKQTLFSHMNHSVHRTEHKRVLLERKAHQIEQRMDEMERLDWISSPDFSLAEWAAGK